MDKYCIVSAAEAISNADAVLVTAGAGMGVDSGLPDFRGTEGFWKAYPPLHAAGLKFEDIASPEWFDVDPRMAWAFYGHRLDLYRRVKPHEGYSSLLRVIHGGRKESFVYTSNVDGHFVRAGFSSENVEECHGSIHLLQCQACCGSKVWSSETHRPKVDMVSFRETGRLPTCPRCERVARPAVMMFGDYAWDASEFDVQAEKRMKFLETVARSRKKLVVVELGAGTSISTVRDFSETVSAKFRCPLVRINVRESQGPTSSTISVPMGARDALLAIEALIKREK